MIKVLGWNSLFPSAYKLKANEVSSLSAMRKINSSGLVNYWKKYNLGVTSSAPDHTQILASYTTFGMPRRKMNQKWRLYFQKGPFCHSKKVKITCNILKNNIISFESATLILFLGKLKEDSQIWTETKWLLTFVEYTVPNH